MSTVQSLPPPTTDQHPMLLNRFYQLQPSPAPRKLAPNRQWDYKKPLEDYRKSEIPVGYIDTRGQPSQPPSTIPTLPLSADAALFTLSYQSSTLLQDALLKSPFTEKTSALLTTSTLRLMAQSLTTSLHQSLAYAALALNVRSPMALLPSASV